MKPHFLYLTFFLIVLVIVSGCTQSPQDKPDQKLLAGGEECKENTECQSDVCDLYKQNMGKCAPEPCSPGEKTNHNDFYCDQNGQWEESKQAGDVCAESYECYEEKGYENPAFRKRESVSCTNKICTYEAIQNQCEKQNLTEILNKNEYDDQCTQNLVKQESEKRVCTPCGNGVCDQDETKCNCPEDCKKSVEESSVESQWEEGGIAVSGKYADADVVDLGESYRMYFSAEPEVQNFEGQVYSAVSTDGKKWTLEDGERRKFSTFPDVLKLPDGRWRMYFQNAGEIKSAISQDGLTWTEESGTRIKAEPFEGQAIENVAAPTTFLLEDGTHLMVYRITINKKYDYPDMLPNSNTQLFLWATSEDGLNFEKKGIAVDSRKEPLLGLADGPDLVDFDGETRLYFWSYKGVYHIVYEDGFSEEPVFDYTTSNNPLNKFPENPPGDPTLIKTDNTWFMYYGSHTKGIYYASLEAE